MNEINNLLSKVAAINIKYDGISKITGESFNIFKLLGVENSEVKTHTMLISQLLNPKGSHGQKDSFLKLFVSQFGIQNFDTTSALATAELYIGTKTGSTGGRIDIIVTDKNNNHIIIENKIYAYDQENQLLRYYNHGGGKAHLFYLTLSGDTPGEWSTGGKLNDSHYKSISYKIDILTWLDDCIKESVNLPMLRETLNQYIYLIKHLTNQTTNHKMQEEIVKLILKDQESLQSFISLYEAGDKVTDQIIENFKITLEPIAAKYGLKLEFGLNRYEAYSGFTFTNDQLAKYNVVIRFEFEKKFAQNFYFGFCYINPKRKNDTAPFIATAFREFFGEEQPTDSWPAWAWMQDYRWWTLETFAKANSGELSKVIEEKLQKMLQIVKQ